MCYMISFIFLDRLYEKGLNPSEIMFVHKLFQTGAIHLHVSLVAAGLQLPPMDLHSSATLPGLLLLLAKISLCIPRKKYESVLPY